MGLFPVVDEHTFNTDSATQQCKFYELNINYSAHGHANELTCLQVQQSGSLMS